MPNRGKHGKARAAAAEAREDIMSSAALSAMSAGAVNAMAAVGAAVIKLHKEMVDKEPEWFWNLFAKCEAKAGTEFIAASIPPTNRRRDRTA